MRRPLLIICAAPYGYGPTAKALCLADELVSDFELAFCSDAHAVSLGRAGPFGQCAVIRDRDSWPDDAIELLRSARGLLSFMDHRSLRHAVEHGVPAMFFDSLHWLRASAPLGATSWDLYIKQRFFLASDLLGSPGRREHFVGPILPRSCDSLERTRPRAPCVFLHVGGVTGPATVPGFEEKYIRYVVRVARAIASFAHVKAAIPKHLCVQERLPYRTRNRIAFMSPTPNELVRELAMCDLLLTTPGLEIVLEAMFLKIPMFFLDPTNATQLIQERTYLQLGIPLGHLNTQRIEKLALAQQTDAQLRTMTVRTRSALMNRLADGRERDDAIAINGVLARIRGHNAEVEENLARNTALVSALGTRGRELARQHIRDCLGCR